jgi:hypothetical protein
MRRELLTGTVTSLLLKPCKHRLFLVTSFKLAKSLYSRSTPLERINILAPLLQVIWITKFTRLNLQHMLAFFFSSVYSSYHFSFPSTLKTFLSFITVTMLSLYQSIYCRRRNREGNFTHKMK